MLVSLQILHAITFGITYLAAVEIVNRSCEPEFRQKAQSNLLAFGLGTGSFIGRTICGLLVGSLVTVASYQYVFMTSGIICLVGVIVLVRNHSKYSEIL